MRTRLAAAAATVVVLSVACSAPSEPPKALDAETQSEVVGERSEPVSQPVKVVVGHCWVEPVQFEGEAWIVPEKLNYLGSGGQFHQKYDNFKGTGEMTAVSPTRAVFRDAGGSEVQFRPVDYLRQQGKGLRPCD